MIDTLPGTWGMVQLAIQGALVVWALAGLVLAVLPPASAYSIEGKWPKPAWIGICAVAALMFAIRPFGFLSIIAMVAVGVFFADVRPAVGGRRR
ncbi:MULTISPECIES: DUF2516 family protein [Dietzia]|uniref:DUF2516 family protein n=1 Tax=Dietzia maris TaxID=37915 RepID=A0A365PA73_9ACTN|nr:MULTISPECIES: DUF2516 family protein [Dietzia]MBB0989955.1 DUF2516 family protein [Dietzia sp. SLG510A3-30A2]MBB0994538.1 DUF2516 family protein [Dietzia sp. SLG510A3-40A3]MBB1009089.1 DUF2516 family protein [Dietzia sp. SLG510A3-3B2-2]MBB1016816.1 DUF2516 family protein [Dietzia sp. DQ11-71]ODQ83388.1 hypothetical protein BFG51_10255 [Dietzia alimentaria]HBD21387.1 DUF2516 domain-containing protein [Dietzia sp.]